MEYVVLARKWRPQTFQEVVGQDHVVTTLRNAVRQNRVAHALLFSGPRGIGKTSVARVLSKALNCEKGPTDTPCDQCTNCREIRDGLSMDVREIDGASNRGIDEVRELRENVKFSPVSSKYKIYIIDEVHMLTKEAFNALLKTIEEPPSHVIFMFATTEIHKVPATILSRCQRHDFRRVPVRVLTKLLTDIAATEGIKISERGILSIAEAGQGSIRDAQGIFDQVTAYAGKEVPDEAVEDLLGHSDRRLVSSLSKAILDRNGKECLGIIEEAYLGGTDVNQFYQGLLDYFRNLLLFKVAGTGSITEAPESEIPVLKERSALISKEGLQRLLEILMEGEEEIRKSLNPRWNLEFTVIKMASLETPVPVNELISKLEDIEARLSPGSTREAEPASSKYRPETPEGNNAAHESQSPAYNTWDEYKNRLKKKSYPLWSKIERGTFISFENNCLKIGFPEDDIFADSVGQKDQRERLLEIARDLWGPDASVRIEYQAAQNGINGTQKNTNHKQNIRREALNQPLVQKVMDLFEGAEVREVITRTKNNS